MPGKSNRPIQLSRADKKPPTVMVLAVTVVAVIGHIYFRERALCGKNSSSAVEPADKPDLSQVSLPEQQQGQHSSFIPNLAPALIH
jgi:hypothetical protein